MASKKKAFVLPLSIIFSLILVIVLAVIIWTVVNSASSDVGGFKQKAVDAVMKVVSTSLGNK